MSLILIYSFFIYLLKGNIFQSAIFNQTVTITELDEGLDGET